MRNIKFDYKWFVNSSETDMPRDFKWVLSLEMEFALPIEHTQFPIFKLIADVEKCINFLTNRLNKGDSHNSIQKAILQIHTECVRFLKKNKHLIIVLADTGGATVAMLKSSYEEKMKEIFNDTTSYDNLKKSALNKLESRSNELVNRLFHSGEIDEVTKKRWIAHNTQIPRVYALPKVHKNPKTTLRHIVSTPGSSSSNLFIYLDNLLKKVIHNQ